jgi:hypothetical protein
MEEKREYTPENLAVVKRVRTCKVTEYYEILALKTDCDEGEVKKAYRKVSHSVIHFTHAQCSFTVQLALALHPDKNGAPGADEAFKSMYLSETFFLPILSVLILTCSGFQGLSGSFWFVFDHTLMMYTSHMSMEQTHKSGQYTIAVGVTRSQGLAACRPRGLHQVSRRVRSVAPRLKGSSAQKIFSTCSSAEVHRSVAILVADQVNFHVAYRPSACADLHP